MSELIDNKQMEGLTAEKQAAKAIAHTLRAIVEDKRKYDVMGFGTQSFDLMTEALATLWDKPVREIRQQLLDARRN